LPAKRGSAEPAGSSTGVDAGLLSRIRGAIRCLAKDIRLNTAATPHRKMAAGPAVDRRPALHVGLAMGNILLRGILFRTISDLDRPGVRVAGEANTTTIRAAARELKSASVVAVPSVAEAIDMLRSGRVDAFALGRDALVPYQAEIPGSRILEGHLHSSGIAIAVPKQRPAALAYVSAFLNEAKASGSIRRVFDRAGLQSATVAPAE